MGVAIPPEYSLHEKAQSSVKLLSQSRNIRGTVFATASIPSCMLALEMECVCVCMCGVCVLVVNVRMR